MTDGSISSATRPDPDVRANQPGHAEKAPLSPWRNLGLALRLARRDLRGGLRGLTTVLLCLALGVGVIAAVGSLRAAVDAGLAADGRRILGGDVAVDGGNVPLPDTLRGWLRDRGAVISDVTMLRSLLVAPSGERTLIELKAVDAAWPLVGTAETAPAQPIAAALANRDGHFGLLADPLVLDRLGLKTGDLARLGTATLRVAGALTTEPDRVATPSIFGPRVLISRAALARTGLIAPGTMARYAIRATLPPSEASVARPSCGRSSRTKAGGFAIPRKPPLRWRASSTRPACS